MYIFCNMTHQVHTYKTHKSENAGVQVVPVFLFRCCKLDCAVRYAREAQSSKLLLTDWDTLGHFGTMRYQLLELDKPRFCFLIIHHCASSHF